MLVLFWKCYVIHNILLNAILKKIWSQCNSPLYTGSVNTPRTITTKNANASNVITIFYLFPFDISISPD